MKHFWKYFTIFSILIFFTLFFLIANLKSNDSIIYTNEPAEKTSPTIERSDPYFGADDPKITIIVYSDFECETCARTALSLKNVYEKFPDDILVIWKDFPNQSLHPNAVNAAVAARCAQRQDKFWEYHDVLMNHQTTLGTELYQATASDLGLRESKFNSCIKRSKTMDLVLSGYEQSIKLGLAAPPTIFVNGKSYTGLIKGVDLLNIVNDILLK